MIVSKYSPVYIKNRGIQEMEMGKGRGEIPRPRMGWLWHSH